MKKCIIMLFLWVVAALPAEAAKNVCGDDHARAGEECDGTDLGGDTCQTLGYDGGELSCASSCTFEVSQCYYGDCTDEDCQSSQGPWHGDDISSYPTIVSSLLDDREGWASDVTGGSGGTVFVVNTLDDLGGSRSLRAALESSETLWIMFADGVDGDIVLQSKIALRDGTGGDGNKTVDGREHTLNIRTETSTFNAIQIENGTNYIFTDLSFDDQYSSWDSDGEGSDAFTVINSSNIWWHQSYFSRWADGAIDIRYDSQVAGSFPTNFSITNSHFNRIYQALVFQGDNISMGHSWCDQVRVRCPAAGAAGATGSQVFSYNNLVEQWSSEAILVSKNDSDLHTEYCIFDSTLNPDGWEDVNKRTNTKGNLPVGLINNENIHEVGTIVWIDGNTDSVDQQFLSDSRDLVNITTCSTQTCWDTLRSDIETSSGPR